MAGQLGLSSEQAGALFRRLDVDGNGTLDYDEFQALFDQDEGAGG